MGALMNYVDRKNVEQNQSLSDRLTKCETKTFQLPVIIRRYNFALSDRKRRYRVF